jgi:Mce-associated membrane protein
VARQPAAEISEQHRNFEENNTKVGEDMSITAVEDAKSSANDDSDAVEPENRATDDEESGDRDTDVAPKDLTAREERRISLSVRSLSLGVLIVGLIAALGLTTWLYVNANGKFDAQAQKASDNQHAEQVALDYAVRAAVMDYKDLGPWKRALVEGTTPELSKKLSDAANAMEQILLPLEWSSSAKPIAAKVRSHDKGLYVVDAFVSVLTKTVQAAEKLQSTATYSVTIDPSNGWKISDVGGIGQVVGDR